MYSEKRHHARYRTLALADINYADKTGMMDKGVVIDISMGGLAFVSTRMFDMKDFLHFNLFSSSLHLVGNIKRVKEEGKHFFYGVEFRNIADKSKIRLNKFITAIYNKIINSRKINSGGILNE